MAELSEKDKRTLLGPNYKERELTEQDRADQKAATFASRRNWLIGIAVLAAIILFAVFFGSSNR
jgi:hypothetical protein